jgi:hypothetical protein
MTSSISRAAGWLFTTLKRTPTRASPPSTTSEAVIREVDAQYYLGGPFAALRDD